MKNFIKLPAIIMTAVLPLTLVACQQEKDANTPDDKKSPTTVIAYNEETAIDAIFEAEYAAITGSALKHEYMEYQGDGHIVDGTPSTQLEGGLMALPSNNGLFVGYMGAEENCEIEWIITSEVACEANLAISMAGNYKGPGDAALMAVSVNGKDIEFEPQGSCLSRAFSEGISVVVELVHSGATAESIDMQTILYVEGALKKQYIYTSDGCRVVRSTMKRLEEELEKNGFIRIHSGYIVNYSAIKVLNGNTVVLKNNKELPISRNRLNYVREKFFEYIGKSGVII